MNLRRKALFLILFLFKGLTSAPVIDFVFSPEYDITNELNDTIVEILQSIEPRIVTNFSAIAINVKNVNFNQSGEDSKMLDHLRFLEPVVWANETYISYDFVQKKIHYEFVTSLKNSSIIGNYQNDPWFRVNYDENDLQINDIIFGGKTVKESDILRDSMKRFIAYMTSQNINQNNVLIRTLNNICDNQPTKSLTLKYPHFQTHQKQQCYYFIPNVSSTFYNFKNITMVGLTNFQSLNITQEPLVYTLVIENIQGQMANHDASSNAELDFVIDSLSISFEPEANSVRVEGKDYSIILTKSKVKFGEAFSAVIMEILEEAIATSIMPSMINKRKIKARVINGSTERSKEATTEETTNEVSIQVNEKDVEKLVTKQTTIEGSTSTTKSTYKYLAHTTKVNPTSEAFSIKDPGKSSTEKPPHEITMQSEEKPTTSKLLPNDDTTTSSTYDTIQDPPIYHITFDKVAIELISNNYSNPEQIQCRVQNDMKFTHKINAMIPSGKKVLNNESNTIQFQAHVDSMNIFVTKPNTTKGNDLCEFQIHLNQIINVKQSPFSNQTLGEKWAQELIKIKKKIDAVLMPIAKSSIVQKIKPIVCSSLDLCSQSKKIINNFFDRFVHNVSKKVGIISVSGNTTHPRLV